MTLKLVHRQPEPPRDWAEFQRQIAGKIPSHDPIAERGLLACLVLGAATLDDVADLVATDDVFFGAEHRRVWSLLGAAESKGPVDLVSAMAAAREAGAPPSTGAWLRELVETYEGTPSVKAARSYAGTVRARWVQRRLGQVGQRIAALAYQPTRDVSGLVSEALGEVAAVERDSVADAATVSMLDAVKMATKSLQSPQDGLGTSLALFDERVRGLKRKCVYVAAARTSVGKSMLATQVTMAAIKGGDVGALYISLEMPPEMLAMRMICQHGAVDGRKVQCRQMSQDDWSRYMHAATELAPLAFKFNKSQSMSMAEIVGSASAYAKELRLQRKRLGVVVIDHMGLVRPSAAASAKRSLEQEMAEISRGLRYLADQFDCSVLALSQINREFEKSGKDRPPMMHELRGSGAIENDADVIAILHRKRLPNGTFENDDAELIIAKDRVSGGTGPIPLRVTEAMRFVSRFT